MPEDWLKELVGDKPQKVTTVKQVAEKTEGVPTEQSADWMGELRGKPLKKKVSTTSTSGVSTSVSGESEKATPLAGEVKEPTPGISALAPTEPIKVAGDPLQYLQRDRSTPTAPTPEELRRQEQKIAGAAMITQNKGQLHQQAYTYAKDQQHYASNAIADIIEQKFPEDYYPNQLKANNYLNTDQPDLAVKELDVAIAKNADNPNLYAQRAVAKQRAGVDATMDAKAYIQSVGGMAHGNKDVANELSNMYAVSGDEEKAKYWRSNYNELVKEEGRQAEAKTLQGFPDWFYTQVGKVAAPITIPVGMAESAVMKAGEAVSEMSPYSFTPKVYKETLPKMLQSGVDAFFAGIGFTPAGAVFNAAVSAGEDVGAGEITQWAMAPVSMILQKNGVDESKLGEWDKLGVTAGNILPMLLFAKGSHFLGKKIADREPLKADEVRQVDETLATTTQEDVTKTVKAVDDFVKSNDAARQVSEGMKAVPDVPAYRIGDKLYTGENAKTAFLSDLTKAKENGASKVDWEVSVDEATANEAREMFMPKVTPEVKVAEEIKAEPLKTVEEIKAEPFKPETVSEVPHIVEKPTVTEQDIKINSESAKKSLSKRIKGDALLDSEDLIDELSTRGINVNKDGTVTLYHRTTSENAKLIEQSGEMYGLEDGVFFSTKETGQAEAYGDAVVKMNVPIEKLQLDDIFEDEAHLQIPTKRANQKISVGQYAPKISIKKEITPEVTEKPVAELPEEKIVEPTEVKPVRPSIVSEIEKVKSKKEGETYAIKGGEIKEGGVPEYKGVPQGENIPKDKTQVREVEGEQAGGGGGYEKGREVTPEIRQRFKNTADKIRSFKIQEGLEGAKTAGISDTRLWNDALETAANIVETTGDVAQSITDGLSKLQSKEDKDQFEKFMRENFEMTATKHAETAMARERLGLPQYERAEVSDVQLEAEADRLIKEGYDAPDLIRRMKDEGHTPNRIETIITQKYIADLYAKAQKAPTDENLSAFKDAMTASDIAGTEESAAFRMRQKLFPVEESEVSFMVDNMERVGVNKLTDAQKAANAKEFAEISDVNKQYREKIEKLEDENKRLKAQRDIDREAKRSKTARKTEVIRKERANLFEQLRAERKREDKPAAMGYGLSLAEEKLIARIAKNYVEDGVVQLDRIVTEIYDNIKDTFEGITDRDIRSVLAGETEHPRPTRAGLSAEWRNLRTEARLTNKLADILSGKEPVSEKRKIERNQRIAELQDQINNARRINKRSGLSEEEFSDINKIKASIKRTDAEIAKIGEQLKQPGFLARPEKKVPILEDKELQKRFPKEYKEALDKKDELIRVRQAREIRMLREKYMKTSTPEKISNWAIEVAGVPRTLMASADLSAVLRQGVILSASHPMIAGRAFKSMLRQTKSRKEFDRWLTDLYDAPDYPVMKESKLYISDPRNPLLEAQEEQFMNNIASKIPIIGAMIRGSERAYISYLNKLRVDVFRQQASAYEAEGKTFYNSKKLYEETANYINNAAGRGNLGKLEGAAKYLNTVFFSPRLIASRVNMLTMFANPKFYTSMPKEVRVMYLKDMGKFVGAGMTMLALAKMSGAEVGTDPRSSDFGKIKLGNTRYDIWGGFQPYVRVIAQSIAQSTKSATTGKVRELGSKFGQQSTGDIWLKFFRSKLAPVPATIADVFAGKTMMGEPLTVKNEVIEKLLPLITSDIGDAIRDGGIGNAFGVGAASIIGIGVQTYPATGWGKSQTVSLDGEDINALGEKSGEYDDTIWKQLSDYKINVRPSVRTDMTYINQETGKDEKYTKEQYFNYVKTRGDAIKEYAPQIIDDFTQNEADYIQKIMELKKNGVPVFKDETIAKKALYEIFLPGQLRSLVRKANQYGKDAVVGVQSEPSAEEKDVASMVEEYNRDNNP